MSRETDPSGLQGTSEGRQVETRFVIYVDGKYYDCVKDVLSSINDSMAEFGANARVGVEVQVGTCTLSGYRTPTPEEKIKIAGLIEKNLRERLSRSGNDCPISVKAEGN